ncbi:hypothetical protein [Dehalobacter sp. TBBPA1]|uniref:hypothetical protein n=1 Tax=Dehalobacter sp. TBBPA1 TaxID=3235037 RepID=UPI0034A49BB9
MAQELLTGIKKYDSNDNVSREALNNNFQIINDKLIEGENTLTLHLGDFLRQISYAVATGSANTYSITLNSAPTSYIDGMAFAVKINVDNTGASTINVNSLGSIPMVNASLVNLSAGDLKANCIYTFRYESSNGKAILQGGVNANSFLKYGVSNNTNGYFDVSTTAPTGTQRLNYSGYFYATRVYNAVYNDYAEYFLKDDFLLEKNDVVCLNPDGKGYIKSRFAYDPLVVGVYSNCFAQCVGGKGDGNDERDFASVGVSGRVPVKVIGIVKKGDLLVASDIPGVAMASEHYIPGTVIGKAQGDKNDLEIGLVFMLIMNS